MFNETSTTTPQKGHPNQRQHETGTFNDPETAFSSTSEFFIQVHQHARSSTSDKSEDDGRAKKDGTRDGFEAKARRLVAMQSVAEISD